MQIHAIINIGSNSVELDVYKAKNGYGAEHVHGKKEKTDLAEEFFPEEVLKEEGIGRTLEVFKSCKEICDSLRVDEIRPVSTGIAQKAKNIRNFTKRIKDKFGWNVEFFSEQEEAQILYKGAVADFEDSKAHFLLVKVDFESTNLIYGNKKSIKSTKTIPLGLREMIGKYIQEVPIQNHDMEAFIQTVGNIVQKAELPKVSKDMIYILSDEELGRMIEQGFPLVKSDHPSASHSLKITVEEFSQRIDEIRRVVGVQTYPDKPNIEDTVKCIVARDTMMLCIAGELGIKECVPSDNDFSDGLILEVLE